MSRPWYRREFEPAIVPEAKPPMPFVSSHSRLEAAAKSVQMLASKLIILLIDYSCVRGYSTGRGIYTQIRQIERILADLIQAA